MYSACTISRLQDLWCFWYTVTWKESASQNTQDSSLTSKSWKIPVCWKLCKLRQAGSLHLSPSWTMKIQTWIQWSPPAVAETASEILRKHGQKKKSWIIAEILDLCDKRRELTKKRFELVGSEKHKEVSNNIKRCMKNSKENWIYLQCGEIEENLRKKNSDRAYELVKDLTTVKQGNATTDQDRSGKCLTEEQHILNWWTE